MSSATTTSRAVKSPKDWSAAEIRDAWMDYYRDQLGHSFMPSSSVVVHEDPSFFFANAGMNQLRAIFRGHEDPVLRFGCKRACNSQKCIRAWGSHNDIEDAGLDSYHHTFFEMLGCWSFGDYYKKEAATMAWKLNTEIYCLPVDQLYVTYFGGDEKMKLGSDEEMRGFWLELGLKEDHIVPGTAKDNFWDMGMKGGMGPCGPSTEIHFDRIGNRNAAHLVNNDDPDVVEIWNLVMIQYDRDSEGVLNPLPAKHVDGCAGFERLVSAVQGKTSNYDTDLFTPLLKRISELSGARPYAANFADGPEKSIDDAYRVICDHVRALTFAIADGGLPSDEGRGYVMRRLVRRASWYARNRLNIQLGTFLSTISATVIEELGGYWTELTEKPEHIKTVLDEEEGAYAKVFDQGEELLRRGLEDAKACGRDSLDDKVVWELYERLAYPFDLTRLMAKSVGLKVDEAAFDVKRASSTA